MSTKQRWTVGLVGLVLFGLSMVPYVGDLIQHPNVGNAVLLLLIVSVAVWLGIVVLKHH